MFFLRLKNTQGTNDFTLYSAITSLYSLSACRNDEPYLGQKNSSRETFFLWLNKFTFSQSQIKFVVELVAENAAFMHHIINFRDFWWHPLTFVSLLSCLPPRPTAAYVALTPLAFSLALCRLRITMKDKVLIISTHFGLQAWLCFPDKSF